MDFPGTLPNSRALNHRKATCHSASWNVCFHMSNKCDVYRGGSYILESHELSHVSAVGWKRIVFKYPNLVVFQIKIPGIGFLKIHAPWSVLCREAEFMKLKMPTKKVLHPSVNCPGVKSILTVAFSCPAADWTGSQSCRAEWRKVWRWMLPVPLSFAFMYHYNTPMRPYCDSSYKLCNEILIKIQWEYNMHE